MKINRILDWLENRIKEENQKKPAYSIFGCPVEFDDSLDFNEIRIEYPYREVSNGQKL